MVFNSLKRQHGGAALICAAKLVALRTSPGGAPGKGWPGSDGNWEINSFKSPELAAKTASKKPILLLKVSFSTFTSSAHWELLASAWPNTSLHSATLLSSWTLRVHRAVFSALTFPAIAVSLSNQDLFLSFFGFFTAFASSSSPSCSASSSSAWGCSSWNFLIRSQLGRMQKQHEECKVPQKWFHVTLAKGNNETLKKAPQQMAPTHPSWRPWSAPGKHSLLGQAHSSWPCLQPSAGHRPRCHSASRLPFSWQPAASLSDSSPPFLSPRTPWWCHGCLQGELCLLLPQPHGVHHSCLSGQRSARRTQDHLQSVTSKPTLFSGNNNGATTVDHCQIRLLCRDDLQNNWNWTVGHQTAN